MGQSFDFYITPINPIVLTNDALSSLEGAMKFAKRTNDVPKAHMTRLKGANNNVQTETEITVDGDR